MVDLEGVKVIPEPSKEYLCSRTLLDYEDHRKNLIEWLLVFGKDPEKGEGYASETVRNSAYRLDKFYRWVWSEEDQYTTRITHSHANNYMKILAMGDESNYSKTNTQCAIKRLFKWKHYEHNGEMWDPDITFSEPSASSAPRDFLTLEERTKIREAALSYGSIPGYNDLTPSDRDKWRSYLAQRFGKKKSNVNPADWERANSWKFPTIVWVSLDAGLRPVEVKRAKVSWVDVENAILRIPKEESSKNEGNWVVSLQERTAKALDRWLKERRQYKLYENSDRLWLTRFGNPYQASSLRQLLIKLFDIAAIPTKNRQVSWYTIRHSVGTYMTREEGLAATQAQLRHKSEKTTMRYDQTPVEDRRDALNRMG